MPIYRGGSVDYIEGSSFVRMMNYLKEHQEIECVLISGFEGITRDYEKITEIYDLHKMLYIVYGNNRSTLSHAIDSDVDLKNTPKNCRSDSA